VELSLAQFGVLKVMMMELLKTKIEQIAVHRDIASLLRAVQELPDVIARKGEGAAAMWGPDGGDLFEQMSRPICARVEDMMRPMKQELQELRNIVTHDGGAYSAMLGQPLGAGSRTIPATMARATARTAKPESRSRTEEPIIALQGWTQGLQHIAEWVHIGGQPQAQPLPSQTDSLVLEGSQRRAKIAGALAEPANDLVIINDYLADGERVHPPTISISASVVSTSDVTSLKSEMENFGSSYRGGSPVPRAAVSSTARNGTDGLEQNKGSRALPASTTSYKDVTQPRNSAIRPSAQGSGLNPLSGRVDLQSGVDRQAGRQTTATDDRGGHRPHVSGRGREAEGARMPARKADHPSVDGDSLRQPSQPALSRRAAMPQDKSRGGGGGRGVREGGRGGNGLSAGYGH
jgi:hypothetical protein